MMKAGNLIFILLAVASLCGCEENFSLDIPEGEELLVVQGHIEQGQPPVVVLTRTVPVFTKYTEADLEKKFVHNAQVTVTTEGTSYNLEEVASTSFTPEIRQLLEELFQVPLEKTIPQNGFIFYVYTTEDLKGEVGKSYRLKIRHNGKTLTSSTTIPELNPLERLWTIPHPDPEVDTLVTLMYRYRDPDTLGNSIRYFTKRNNEPYYPGYRISVYSDEMVNGADYIDYPLERGRPVEENSELGISSFFSKGDTVTVKWSAIDVPHFRFWKTLETERSTNGSPIGNPNSTRSNIQGGLGIWGGYSSTYHTIIIEK